MTGPHAMTRGEVRRAAVRNIDLPEHVFDAGVRWMRGTAQDELRAWAEQLDERDDTDGWPDRLRWQADLLPGCCDEWPECSHMLAVVPPVVRPREPVDAEVAAVLGQIEDALKGLRRRHGLACTCPECEAGRALDRAYAVISGLVE